MSMFAQAEPAGGAALDQVFLATAGATLFTAVLLWLVARHRGGRRTLLEPSASLAARVTGLPGWAALPLGIAGVSLVVALLGMMWDISLHVADGRDEGPLANPAHYLILFGLFGIFTAGTLAIALPRGERPGPAALRITRGWYAPIGGLLMVACSGFALAGFPLDDVWHRLFGQDVTLWGPTHLMLIGGAGLTLVGMAVLMAEGTRARPASVREGDGSDRWALARKVALMGGLLAGLSTFQGEFDFGIPQFRLVFHPFLIAVAGGVALVAARVWIGRGGALGAVAFFLVLRGIIAVIVGPGLDEPTPWFPLYVGEALTVEAIALAITARRRPLAFGLAAGVGAAAVGFPLEWWWTGAVMPIAWTEPMLVEGLLMALAGGAAGGALGALLGASLRSELPRPVVARGAFAAALATLVALTANGLVTEAPEDIRAVVDLEQVADGEVPEALATVRLIPADAADDAVWVSTIAWQGEGLRVDALEEVAPGVFRSTQPVPVGGPWKSSVRLHLDRALLGVPLHLPADPAIPAPEVAPAASFERPAQREIEILQRERREGTSPWLWTAANIVVGTVALALLLALGWGLDRVARAGRRPDRGGPPAPGAGAGPSDGRAGDTLEDRPLPSRHGVPT